MNDQPPLRRHRRNAIPVWLLAVGGFVLAVAAFAVAMLIVDRVRIWQAERYVAGAAEDARKEMQKAVEPLTGSKKEQALAIKAAGIALARDYGIVELAEEARASPNLMQEGAWTVSGTGATAEGKLRKVVIRMSVATIKKQKTWTVQSVEIDGEKVD